MFARGTSRHRDGRSIHRHGPSRHRSVQALSAVLLAAALALAGCGANDSSAGSSADSAAKAAPPGAGNAEAGAAGPGGEADSRSGEQSGDKATTPPKLTGTHVIRTASLTVLVKDVPKALDEARSAAEGAGGIVGNESTIRDEDSREESRVVLRVPTEQYEEVITELQGTGKLMERKVKAQDVTDQVVDVESRIKTMRASVERVRELMDKATKLSDVVALEGELSSRQSDLEALLAQQASLKDRTSLATITLTLYENPKKQVVKEDDDPGFLDALAGGWHAFVTLLRWIAVAFGAALPFVAAAALIILVWLRVVRSRLPRGARTPLPAGGPAGPPATGTTSAAPAAGPGSAEPSAPAARTAGADEEHGGDSAKQE
ncbi:DUF4349 domain-containing protein [Streptomyces sp. PSKA54]|uniref:DUF4349 domain-containing protein n=1 Tax=Streptomyces himalayensis subsp. aureolus TaxID=2758039 RepID=A0A7W2D468_9ACTN|nr:DUF4349 domain-containing protein [Streptomyces himalayensis]MBA4864145.1 DUF4349 domain-containing protein [Streptomyces himalayensis subsp. aureolus]